MTRGLEVCAAISVAWAAVETWLTGRAWRRGAKRIVELERQVAARKRKEGCE